LPAVYKKKINIKKSLDIHPQPIISTAKQPKIIFKYSKNCHSDDLRPVAKKYLHK
jgi:hypothetical protein